MTAIQYVETVLQNRWDDSDLNGDRHDDVPDIGRGVRVFRESAASRRKVASNDYDVIFVKDGGVTNVEPQGINWQRERQVSVVTVDIRTTESRERLWGKRDSDNNAPTYGGLTGEVKRCFDEVRKGHKENDLVRVPEMNDLSGQMGGQVWRASITVELDNRSNHINP